MNLAGKLKKIKEYPRLLLFQILLDRITFRFIQFRRFHLLEYSGLPAIGRTRGPGRVREAAAADMAGIEALGHSGTGEVLQKRLSAGDCCVVADLDGKIVGYEWYTTVPHQEQRYRYPIPVPPDSVYVYDAYIDPAFRISGVWIKLKKHIGEQMARLGRERVVTMIDGENKLSLNTHLRFGFKVFKNIDLIKVGAKRYFRERTPEAARSGRES